MSSRPTHVALLALLVVLAGCSFAVPGQERTPAPTTATTTGTATSPPVPSTATPSPSVPSTVAPSPVTPSTPTGEPEEATAKLQLLLEPSYDARQVLERVERLRGRDVVDRVQVFTYGLIAEVRFEFEEDQPDRYAGIERPGATALQLHSDAEVPSSSQRLGYADREDGIVHVRLLDQNGLDEFNFTQEAVLAHELVHAIQMQHGLLDPDRDVPDLTDELLASTMTIEGNAALVHQRYRDRYLSNTIDVQSRNHSGARANWTSHLGSIAYYYGYRYAAAADGWEERTERVRPPRPNTTAAILHPERGPREPGRPVPVPEASNLTVIDRDRVGELVVRFSLRTNGASFPTAAAAATGWRNDTMVYYDDADAVYWGTRWTNGSEAAEFVDAWLAMLDRRGATRDDGLVVVPGTEAYPRTYYAVERSGAVVRMAAGENRTDVRRIATGWRGSSGGVDPLEAGAADAG